jgi:hypothetical protein
MSQIVSNFWGHVQIAELLNINRTIKSLKIYFILLATYWGTGMVQSRFCFSETSFFPRGDNKCPLYEVSVVFLTVAALNHL